MEKMMILFTVCFVSCKPQADIYRYDRRISDQNANRANELGKPDQKAPKNSHDEENYQPQNGDESSKPHGENNKTGRLDSSENPESIDPLEESPLPKKDGVTIAPYEGEVSRSEFVRIARLHCGDCHQLKLSYSNQEIDDILRRIHLAEGEDERMPQGRDWVETEDQAKFIAFIKQLQNG